jgi:hypothetical protein
LGVLRILEEAGCYTANSMIIQDALLDMGIPVSSEELEDALDWLKRSGLIELSRGEFLIPTITRQGLELAQGLVRREGVRRPLL